MELTQVKTLALKLMEKHGVGHLDFEFSRTKRAIGSCHMRRNHITGVVTPTKITLSRYWMPRLPDCEVVDTILHEIAHALTPGDGHGAKWRAMCRKIGANPERTLREEMREVALEIRKDIANYKVICDCAYHKGKAIYYFHRMTKKWKDGSMTCKRSGNPVRVVANR